MRGYRKKIGICEGDAGHGGSCLKGPAPPWAITLACASKARALATLHARNAKMTAAASGGARMAMLRSGEALMTHIRGLCLPLAATATAWSALLGRKNKHFEPVLAAF